MTAAVRSKLLFVPPPLAFVLAFLCGVAINSAVPLALPMPFARAIGAIAIAAGGALMIGAVALFILRRTTIIPFADPSGLVASGPYRITRNPMYVGLALAYSGIALALPSLWSLLFLPLPLLLLEAVVIPFEEGRMRAAFGSHYAAYCRRVPRWLWPRGAVPDA